MTETVVQSRIHPTAIVDPRAQLHETVEVGPYSVIGADVEVGEGCWIGAHVVLKGPLRVGRRNRIFPFASLGEISQDLTARPEDPTRVEIGDDNIIREWVSVQRGTLKDSGVTRIGNHNLLMNYVHVGHDCTLGNHGVFANGTQFGGHIVVEDWVVLGGATLVLQYVRLGAHCFSAGGAGITRDVPPFVIVQENPAKPRGVNLEGLRRRGFSAEDVSAIKHAYRSVFMAGLNTEQAMAALAESAESSPPVAQFVEFLRNSRRIVQK